MSDTDYNTLNDTIEKQIEYFKKPENKNSLISKIYGLFSIKVIVSE